MRVAKRILITNYVLDQGSGTEMYVFDLALALLIRGRLPIVYSPRPGMLFRRMQQLGICVVDNLSDIGAPPDVIHGNHTLETIAAAMRFPMCPALFVCHDCSTWYDTAPSLPNIVKYVGVDQACYDRLVFQHGVAPERLQIVPNGVDLARFPLRESLPAKPQSLLCFGHGNNHAHVDVVRRAAPQLHVESIGSNTNRHIAEPGPWLAKFDIIMARGRSAREAIATGAATIVADATGVGEMVSSENYAFSQINNFGRRLLRNPYSIESIRHAIDQYNAVDAWAVVGQHREQNSISAMVQSLVETYDQMLDAYHPEDVQPETWHQQASQWLEWCSLHANLVLPLFPTGELPQVLPPVRNCDSLIGIDPPKPKDPPVAEENSVTENSAKPDIDLYANSSDQNACKEPFKRTTAVRIYREFRRTLRKMRRAA